MQPLFAGPRARVRLPLFRFWPASVALLLVVAFVAMAQFSFAPRHYTASQQLRVVVVADDQTSAGADVQAEQIARDLSSPAFASSPQLATATLGGLTLREREYNHVSVSAVQTAMTLSHSGSVVELSATWTSPGVATEILSAATHALQTDSSLLPVAQSAGESIRLQATTAPAAAARSSSEAADAVQTLVQRLVLGALVALLLPFALDALLTRRSRTLEPA